MQAYRAVAMISTQRIFAIARPAPDVEWADMVCHMQAEAAHVWALYEQDVLREAWVRTDSLGSVYLVESTPEDAAKTLADFPMAAHQLVDFELIPVGPFTPLSLLFGTQAQPIPAAPSPSAGTTAHTRVLALDRLRPTVQPDDLAPYLVEEARHAWALWKGGVVRENYLRTDRPGAALMLEAAGVPAAQELLQELPLARAGLIEFECLALATFMGFDALLDGSIDSSHQPLSNPTKQRSSQ